MIPSFYSKGGRGVLYRNVVAYILIHMKHEQDDRLTSLLEYVSILGIIEQ